MNQLMRVFHERVRYDPATGSFTWRSGPRAGMPAGSVCSQGYLILSVNQFRCKAHRFALASTGVDIESGAVVDHINGDRTDNRLCNLRVVDVAGNRRNQRRVRSDSKTGMQGVYRRGAASYRAVVVYEGRKRYFGTFGSAQEAHEAYLCGRRQLFPDLEF